MIRLLKVPGMIQFREGNIQKEAIHDGEKNAEKARHEVSEPTKENRQEQDSGEAAEEEIRGIMETIELADGGLLLCDDAFRRQAAIRPFFLFAVTRRRQ
jgi:hypothetical protein